jgi:hypothetical protein
MVNYASNKQRKTKGNQRQPELLADQRNQPKGMAGRHCAHSEGRTPRAKRSTGRSQCKSHRRRTRPRSSRGRPRPLAAYGRAACTKAALYLALAQINTMIRRPSAKRCIRCGARDKCMTTQDRQKPSTTAWVLNGFCGSGK